jgi:hypothetical protein
MLRGIGSARTARDSAEYEIAESTAARLVRAGYTVITRIGHRSYRQVVPPAVPARERAKGYFRHESTPVKRRQDPGQAGRYAPVFTWSANLRHAAGLNRSTGPERSLVSRTSTRSALPTSTHSPPPFEL